MHEKDVSQAIIVATLPITAPPSEIVENVPSEDAFVSLLQTRTDDPDVVCNARVIFLDSTASALTDIADTAERSSQKLSKKDHMGVVRMRIQATFMRVRSRIIREGCPTISIQPQLLEIFSSTAN